MLRAGILLPRSTLFPSINLDFINGFKSYLKFCNIFDNIKLLTDNIGFGIDEPDIYTKAEKMILQEDADIVFVFADAKIAEMLQPLFTASNKLLVMVNFGANLPETWQAAPTTITHSLNFCLHAMNTGRLAAHEENKKTINLLSYYDGGYQICYSLLSSNQQHGAEPIFNHITHLKLSEFTLEPFVEFLKNNPEISNILCLFSGEQAVRFYTEIVPLQKKYNLKLFVSPMMLEPSLKSLLGSEFNIQLVTGYTPWHPSLTNSYNNVFKKTYEELFNKTVNYFSLLGWDAGMILQSVFECYNKGLTNALKIIDEMKSTSIKSPRGWLKLDGKTQHFYGPSYLVKVKNNFDISVVSEEKNIEDIWRAFKNHTIGSGERSGWRNTYLCI